MNKFIAKIHSRNEVALDTSEVTLEINQSFDFTAGQFVELELEKTLYPDTKGNSRFFSIVSSSDGTGIIKVAFRHSQSGFKRSLMEMPIGSEVIVRGPMGGFSIEESLTGDVVFLAGGVGIAPFISLLQSVFEKKTNINVTLLYANTNPKRIIYLPELEKMAEESPNFKMFLKHGYLDIDFIQENIKEIENKTYYISGPPAFVRTAMYQLHELGIPDKYILTREMSGYNSGLNILDKPKAKHPLSINSNGIDLATSSFPVLEALSLVALVSITNTAGVLTYVNDFFVKTSRYTREELVGQSGLMLVADESQSIIPELKASIESGKIWNGEIICKTKDDSLYWTQTSTAPIFNELGKISHYISVQFLVTKQKNVEVELHKQAVSLQGVISEMSQKEKELEDTKKAILNILEDLDIEKKEVEQKVVDRTSEIEREKEKLYQVTKNIRGGIVLFNSIGEVTFTNDSLYEIIKIDTKKINSEKVINILLNYFENTNFKKDLDHCLTGKTFDVSEVEVSSKIYDISFVSFDINPNKIVERNFLVLISDVTESKLLERSKSELVAIASHQLRTPLTAMRGNVEMLIDESYGAMNTNQHELLSDIDISTKRLIGMVNDMLDITKIEKGNLDMLLEQVSIKAVLDSIHNDLKDYASRRGVVINNKSEENSTVYGDRSRVRQVFQNLIDNSIKYSKNPGTLLITTEAKSGFTLITIKDNGIGVPEREQSKLFGRFYRASNTVNSSSSGSGLGLYIVRSIVSQLGGDIWFESKEGVGTTFFVTLPTQKIQ